MLGFQREIINTLRGTVNGLESTIKEIKLKISALENSEKKMTKNYLELKKSLSRKTHNNTEESSMETEVPENQEKGAKFEKKKRRTMKKVQLKEKLSVDSGVGSLEHPWAEWVQFL
jgi:chaperonin cofactor prefoldin